MRRYDTLYSRTRVPFSVGNVGFEKISFNHTGSSRRNVRLSVVWGGVGESEGRHTRTAYTTVTRAYTAFIKYNPGYARTDFGGGGGGGPLTLSARRFSLQIIVIITTIIVITRGGGGWPMEKRGTRSERNGFVCPRLVKTTKRCPLMD